MYIVPTYRIAYIRNIFSESVQKLQLSSIRKTFSFENLTLNIGLFKRRYKLLKGKVLPDRCQK